MAEQAPRDQAKELNSRLLDLVEQERAIGRALGARVLAGEPVTDLRARRREVRDPQQERQAVPGPQKPPEGNRTYPRYGLARFRIQHKNIRAVQGCKDNDPGRSGRRRSAAALHSLAERTIARAQAQPRIAPGPGECQGR